MGGQKCHKLNSRQCYSLKKGLNENFHFLFDLWKKSCMFIMPVTVSFKSWVSGIRHSSSSPINAFLGIVTNSSSFYLALKTYCERLDDILQENYTLIPEK